LANSTKDEIAVRVLFFGAARDAVGQAEVDFVLQGTPTAESAFAAVMKKFPDLARFGRSLLFAVNQERRFLESCRLASRGCWDRGRLARLNIETHRARQTRLLRVNHEPNRCWLGCA